MVDAGGLNPPGAKALYGFDSHLGHQSRTYFQNKSCRTLRVRGGLKLNRPLGFRAPRYHIETMATIGENIKKVSNKLGTVKPCRNCTNFDLRGEMT